MERETAWIDLLLVARLQANVWKLKSVTCKVRFDMKSAILALVTALSLISQAHAAEVKLFDDSKLICPSLVTIEYVARAVDKFRQEQRHASKLGCFSVTDMIIQVDYAADSDNADRLQQPVLIISQFIRCPWNREPDQVFIAQIPPAAGCTVVATGK